MKNKIDYGIDAPEIIRNRLIGGVIFLIIAIGVSVFFRDSIYYLKIVLVSIFSALSLTLIISSVFMILSSKIGKQKESDRIIEMLQIKGDEKVLDAGCGRGLYLIKIAKKLNTGKVIGVDIWSKDLSKNSKKDTLNNVKQEGLSQKIKIKTADMALMPLENNYFDIVISCFAINNIKEVEKRKKALMEITRVLKVGGKLCVIDMRNTEEYVDVFKENGIVNIDIIKTKYLYPRSKIIIGTKNSN